MQGEWAGLAGNEFRIFACTARALLDKVRILVQGSVRPQSGGGAPSAQTQDGSGSRVMELELLCLNETLSNSGSPPRIYFNSLFRTSAAEGASQDQPEEGAPSGQDAKAEQH